MARTVLADSRIRAQEDPPVIIHEIFYVFHVWHTICHEGFICRYSQGWGG